MEYSTNSREEVPRKSLIGKTELNTACNPTSSRSAGGTSICRNRWYDFLWTSIKFGIGILVWILAKSMRSRYTFEVLILVIEKFTSKSSIRFRRAFGGSPIQGIKGERHTPAPIRLRAQIFNSLFPRI